MSSLSIPRLPKLCGADIELGNFVLGLPGLDTSSLASRARGVSPSPYTGNWSSYSCTRSAGEERGDRDTRASDSWNPQDWGRKYLPTNGGCIYIDLDHLELCLPETLSAWDHAAAWHAMLRITRGAMELANDRLPEGRAL